MGWHLAVNAGSSSLKLAAFGLDGRAQASVRLAEMSVADLGRDALSEAIARLHQSGPPVATGHRVVHGLDRTAPARLDAATRAVIARAAGFAPLHNPPALRVIDLCADLFPGTAQVACFDTAFHAGNPRVATTLPIPASLRDAGLRRYGFHGLSYASVVRRFTGVTGQALPRRLLIAHLGAGASMAAVLDGRGHATTMGFSPMDGLPMATRAGAMDPGVIFHLMRQGHAPDAVERMLNRDSGLLALGGTPSMKDLLARDDDAARFAVAHYIHWATRHAGALCAAMGGIDAMVFTGGVGENAAPIRDGIATGLAWAGLDPACVHVIPADEEGEIAAALRDPAG